jgi:hypothetical protein
MVYRETTMLSVYIKFCMCVYIYIIKCQNIHKLLKIRNYRFYLVCRGGTGWSGVPTLMWNQKYLIGSDTLSCVLFYFHQPQ